VSQRWRACQFGVLLDQPELAPLWPIRRGLLLDGFEGIIDDAEEESHREDHSGR
jgi:hypothetical protein